MKTCLRAELSHLPVRRYGRKMRIPRKCLLDARNKHAIHIYHVDCYRGYTGAIFVGASYQIAEEWR